MRKHTFSLLIFIVLGIIVSYNEFIINNVYQRIDPKHFQILGYLENFQTDCKDTTGCQKAYIIPTESIGQFKGSNVYGLGVGVLAGSSKWYCGSPDDKNLFYTSGPTKVGNKVFRSGLLLYNYINISKQICHSDITIIFQKDRYSPSPRAGWMSGPLVTGTPQVVYSYSVIFDFFNSYFRVLLGLAIFIIAYFTRNFQKSSPSLRLYFAAIVYLSAFFITTSSLFDLLSPLTGGVGALLAISSGSSFVTLLLLSDLLLHSSASKRTIRFLELGVFTLFFTFYSIMPSSLYIFIQTGICLAILGRSAYSGNLSFLVFSILLALDIASLYGFLQGFPRGTSAIFLSFKFISDFLVLMRVKQIDLSKEENLEGIINKLTMHLDFFHIKRMSLTTVSKGHSFKTLLFDSKSHFAKDVEKSVFENFEISQLLGNVISTGRSYVRISTGSKLFYRLTGKSVGTANLKLGKEFCCFPIDCRGRNIGMLSVTNYPKFAFLDPFGLFIFTSAMHHYVHFLGPAIFRHYMSSEVEDKKILDEVAAEHFHKTGTANSLYSFVSDISEKMNVKIILSHVDKEKSVFKVLGAFGFSKKTSLFLRNRELEMSDDLAGLGPVNVSFFAKKELYIHDIKSVLNLYPNFLREIFTENRTDSLYVTPLGSISTPWGMIWIEFPDYLKIRSEHIEDLARSISIYVNKAYLQYNKEKAAKRIKDQFSKFVPQRVVQKVSEGATTREQEEGFLLNIDIAGSTQFSKEVGEREFGNFINRIRRDLQKFISPTGFELQMTIWDAFFFTLERNKKPPEPPELSSILSHTSSILEKYNLKCRMVLHYGDITRDFSETTGRSWTISGSALAESIKLEDIIKSKTGIILISREASAKLDLNHMDENFLLENDAQKKAG